VKTVRNKDGSVAWYVLSDEDKMCGPLGNMIDFIASMKVKPILIVIGGGPGSVIEEEIYRLERKCDTYILKTNNVISDTSSSVKPTEEYHVQCELNFNFFHLKAIVYVD